MLEIESGKKPWQRKKQYRYAPLQHGDSIRLLTLYPGPFASSLRISLLDVRLEDNHAYEAVSYTWATEDDDDELSSEVRCVKTRIWARNNRRIQVTKNCELALRYLREERVNRVLWIDAICINQGDNKERGHQVGLMRDVYSNATNVLVWLGEASKMMGIANDTGSDTIMASAKSGQGVPRGSKLSPIPRSSQNDEGQRIDAKSVSNIFLDFFSKVVAERKLLEEENTDPTSGPLFQKLLRLLTGPMNDVRAGFIHLMTRRWWSRIWVVQEVTVAQSVIFLCSSQTINYRDFYYWYRLLRRIPSGMTEAVRRTMEVPEWHLRAVMSAWIDYEDGSYLLTALSRFRRLTASDPRDNIFGVLGLSDEMKAFLPAANYDKSVTDVYTDVTKSFLNTKSLKILNGTASHDPMSDNPSWVTYWSRRNIIHNVKTNAYSATRDSDAIVEFSGDDRELSVMGCKVDEIKGLSSTNLAAFMFNATIEDRVASWRASCAMAFALLSYPTGETVRDALWRTLCWNLPYSRRRYAEVEKTTREAFEEWYSILLSDDTSIDIMRRMNAQENVFIEPGPLFSSSPICTTTKGYLAAVPYTSKPGDVITLLSGGDRPFILRPMGDHYRFVGPCYVHGIMNGEAFPDNPAELGWFRIR